MEHRALALEYRPQTFDEVAGQHHVTAVLTRALAKGRVHSCYLFSGPRGVGKTTTARILAKILNCPHTKDGVPCNECETCREITAGVALDVQEIDGASNRGIADVQQLREKVRFTASGGRYRVIIIDEVHQLSGDAFAALLKTLEEPPPFVVFVFATTDPLKLPDTIRSRCQRYDFGRLSLSAVVARLKEIASGESERGEKIALSDEAAFLLARRSEGSMRDAVSALDQVLSTGVTEVDEAAVTEVLGLVSREVFMQLGGTILGGEPEKALAVLHEAYREGIDPRDLAEGLLDHLRAVLVLRLDPRAEDLVTASSEERARFDEQGEGWDTPDLLRLMRLVTEAMGAMRDSAQPLTHLELAVVEMASLDPGVRMAEILARLGVLSGGPDGGGSSAGSKPVGSKAAGSKSVGSKAAASNSPGRTTRSSGRSAETGAGAGEEPGVSLDVGSHPDPPSTFDGAGASRVRVRPRPPLPESPPPALHPGNGATYAASAAASESAGAVGTLTEEIGESEPSSTPGAPPADTWERTIARVKERKLMVGVFLEESRLIRWEGTSVLVAADEVHKSFLSNAENRELIEVSLGEICGRPARVKFVDAAAAPAPPPAPAPAPVLAPAAPSLAPGQIGDAESAPALAPGQVGGPESAPSLAPGQVGATTPGQSDSPHSTEGSGTGGNGSGPAKPAARRARTAAVSPAVEQAMVWLDADIVQQVEPGGSGR